MEIDLLLEVIDAATKQVDYSGAFEDFGRAAFSEFLTTGGQRAKMALIVMFSLVGALEVRDTHNQRRRPKHQ